MSKFEIKTLRKVKVYDLVEIVFLAFLGLYLAFLAEKTTMYHFVYKTDVESFLLGALRIVTVIKIVLFLWNKRQGLLHDRPFRRKLLIYAVFVAGLWIVYNEVYRSDKYKFLLFLGVLVVGSVGTDYKKIIKTYVISVGLVIGTAILASLAGFIDNIAYMRDGRVQSSWGIVASTDYASIILFVSIAAWIAWKEYSPKVFVIITLISVLNSAFIARSLTSTVSGILFLIAILVNGSHIKKGRKIASVTATVSFPFFAFVTFALIYLYHRGTSIGIKLNTFLHGRLSLLNDGFKNYKLSWFGIPFDQIGRGGTTFARTDYNFIDSSYVLILLRYGIVLFVSIMLLWILMTRKAVKAGDRRLAFGMAIIAVHSFSEHHLIEANYNILIILPFSVLGMGWLTGDEAVEDGGKAGEMFTRKILIAGVSFVCIMTAMILCAGSYFLSFLRTIFDVTAKVEIKDKEKLVCVAFAFIIVLFIIFAAAVYKLICCLYDKLRDNKTSVKKRLIFPLVTTAVVTVVIAGGIYKGNRIIEGRGAAYQPVVDSEADAIAAVKAGIRESGGSFYADDVPMLYRRTYGGVTEGVFKGDELAAGKSVTVLMDADHESAQMIHMGFLYTEISDVHSLYTNDPAVMKELERSGYHMTGYFSRKLTVDLAEEAERNKLDMTSDGAVEIDGPSHSLYYGPYYDLRGGAYTVTYELSLSSVDTYDADYKICTLKVGLQWGGKYVIDQPVFRRDFDDNGRLVKEFKMNISDSRACEFKVLAENGRTVLVNGISCQKTPDIDTHRSCDKKGRVIRESYFDLEGTPIETDNGYHAVSYKYDSNGNVSSTNYYGLDDEPVIIKQGYSGLGRKFDIKKRVIKDIFYDQSGSRMALDDGRSAVAYGYDSKGNRNEYRYYDTDDNLLMLPQGYSIMRCEFDENMKVSHEAYFDTEDNPVMISGGYASVSYDYDDKGREIRRSFYDEEDDLVIADSGYAERWRILDSEGRVLREEYFDAENRRMNLRDGYAIVEYDYDMYGNQSRKAYYNADEIPVMNSSGYAILKREYDKDKHITKEEFFGDGGDRLTLGSGYSIGRYTYDENGNQTDARFYGRDGNPVIVNGTYFHLHREYNDDHQITLETYYDTDEKPITRKEGYVIYERGYDEAGNVAVQRFLDAAGNPVMRTDGYAETSCTFNEKRQLVRVEYRDTSGSPVIIAAGYAVVEYQYDENGNQTDVVFYDLDGNPATWWGGIYGFHRMFDEFKQIIREEYLGMNGQLMMRNEGFAAVEREYDTFGNMTEQRYYDLDNNLSINSDGYAVLCREYDAEKRITKEYYLGLNREPVDSTDGFAVVENTYDADGNLVKAVRYNAKGEVVE